MHKVAGESNPSDLFTKHLESQRKLDELVRLFRCKLVDGRAASAPAVKLGNAQLIDNNAEEDEFVAMAHDPHVLPHEHSPEDIEELFPRLDLGKPVAELDDGEHDLSDPFPHERRGRATKRSDVHLIVQGTSGKGK